MSGDSYVIVVALVIGFVLGSGVKAQAAAQMMGDARLKKLLRLLELLEEPRETRAERRRAERDAER